MPPLSRVPIAPLLMLQNMESWKRQVALVCLAQGVASIGWSFMQPFYPLFIEQELGVESGADAAFWAGASSGVFALFMGIAGPFWGHLADTYGRKPMLVRAYTAGTLVLMFSGLITNIPQLIGVRILHGGVSGSVGAAMALAGSYVPSNRLPLVVGLLQFTSYFSITISPFIGGQLVDAFGFRTTYFISSGFTAAAGLMILFFIKESFQRAPDKKGSPSPFFPRPGRSSPPRACFPLSYSYPSSRAPRPSFNPWPPASSSRSQTPTGPSWTRVLHSAF